ncbi:hypothetical protein [Cytobacillus gottheilii]|uniref:hypothetical protein n=1 Tax=Cytobacillus gottheilii TaxID=859144 RepID=UPI0009BA4EF0|nr:hypothetical protein [Cytobacillus gottheilii]
MTKKAKISIIVILILMPVIFLLSYEESETFEGFPVPKMAVLTKSQSDLEAYEWGPASEENGLPLRYMAIIRLWGWDKKEQEGALTTYEKDGREVELLSQTDYLGLSSSE